jgi:DUF1009 family protein
MAGKSKLGILAGGGRLPSLLAQACRDSGRPAFVLAFEGHTDAATVAGVEHGWVRLGAVGEAVATLRAAGVEEVVMAGPMARPSLSELKLDLKHAYLYAKMGVGALGDDGLLRAIISYLEDQGFRVVGVDDVLAGLLAEDRTYSRAVPDEVAWTDIRRGVSVVVALGVGDVGQAAVVQQGIVLGVEAAEGTDALLERCAGLKREGPGGVLVKLRKPGQERRADLPTIGVGTVENARAAGLRGIAIEAGGSLIIDQPAVVAAADAGGLFLVGIAARS